MRFIQKVEKETNSTRTIRHYLILLSRLLAFTALIFAFAQPYFPNSIIGGGQKSNIIAIYLDNSFSMSAKGTNGNLFNQAKNSIHEMIETMPKDQKYLLVTNELNNSEFRILNTTEIQDKLDEINFSPIFRTIPTILESMNNYLKTNQQDKNTSFFVFSDFQKAILKEEQANVDSIANYSIIQLIPQVSRNIYIDSVWFEQPFQRINTNNSLFVRIVNTGHDKLTNIEVNLKVGDVKRQTLVDLDAQNSTVITLNYSDKTAGFKDGFVEVIDESLFFDNRYYFTYNIKENIRIAILNNATSSSLPSYVYKTDDFYDVQEVLVNQLQPNSLNEVDFIVLNGLKDISSGVLSQLIQLTENGVHLLIIPSMDFDKSSYNELLNTFHLPLYNTIVNQEIRLGKIRAEMPFFTGMFDDKVDKIRMPPLKNHLSSTSYSNANYSPLIEYENGMPLLVRQEKTKNIYALYSPVNSEFTNFGKSALFTAILLRMSELSQGSSQLSLTIGSDDAYIIPYVSQSERALLLKQGDFEFIPEMNKIANSASISVRYAIDHLSIQDGVYEILDDKNNLGKLALNFNRIESDMEYADQKELLHYFKSMNIHRINTTEFFKNENFHQFINSQSNELWKILLLLAFAFFLIEMSIIVFWKT